MMTEPQPTRSADLLGALRTTHRCVVGGLLVCGLVIASQGLTGDEPTEDRTAATIGIALGLVSIVFRRLSASPAIALRSAALLALAGLVSAACLGALGVYLAISQDRPETGLLLTAAGLIFAIRPPALTTG